MYYCALGRDQMLHRIFHVRDSFREHWAGNTSSLENEVFLKQIMVCRGRVLKNLAFTLDLQWFGPSACNCMLTSQNFCQSPAT